MKDEKEERIYFFFREEKKILNRNDIGKKSLVFKIKGLLIEESNIFFYWYLEVLFLLLGIM